MRRHVQLILYLESVLMRRGRLVCGAVSSTRTIAWAASARGRERRAEGTDDELRTVVRLYPGASLRNVSASRLDSWSIGTEGTLLTARR